MAGRRVDAACDHRSGCDDPFRVVPGAGGVGEKGAGLPRCGLGGVLGSTGGAGSWASSAVPMGPGLSGRWDGVEKRSRPTLDQCLAEG